MSMNPIAPPVRPDLRTLLTNTKREVFQEFNCHKIGRIVGFDETKSVASVQLSTLKVLPDGSQVPYPVLTDCPVFVNGGSGGMLSIPIKSGDDCLVLFHDTDIDNWFTTGNVVAPNTPRSHSLSDGLVLVGFPNLARPLVSSTYVRLINLTGSAQVVLYDTGEIFISRGSSSIQISTTGIITLSAANGAVLGADTKLRLENNVTSLKTVMDSFLDVLAAWVNTGGTTPNPATITALAAIKTAFGTLLQ